MLNGQYNAERNYHVRNQPTSNVEHDHNYVYKDTLCIRSLNVCGLKSRLLSDEFVNSCAEADLNFFQESKTDEIDEDEIRDTFSKMNMHVLFKHRSKISKYRSGGLVVIYSDRLAGKVLPVNSDIKEIQWVTLKLDNDNEFLFGNCYIPPENTRYFNADAYDMINVDIIAKTVDLGIDNVFLAGDFNARTNTSSDIVAKDERLLFLNTEETDEFDMSDLSNFHIDTVRKKSRFEPSKQVRKAPIRNVQKPKASNRKWQSWL